jgi:hypothetical protein
LKSSPNNSAARIALGVILTLGSITASAGVAKSATPLPANQFMAVAEMEPTRDGTPRELPTSLTRSERNQFDSSIQCWQYGQLIIDERDWVVEGADLRGPLLRSKAGSPAKLRLEQFGDTFCSMKYGTTAP